MHDHTEGIGQLYIYLAWGGGGGMLYLQCIYGYALTFRDLDMKEATDSLANHWIVFRMAF